MQTLFKLVLSLKDIAKDILIKNQGLVLELAKAMAERAIWIPGRLHNSLIGRMGEPTSLEAEGSRSSTPRHPRTPHKQRMMVRVLAVQHNSTTLREGSPPLDINKTPI